MARSVPGQYRRARLSRSFVSAAPIDAGERAGIPRGGPPAALSFIARTPDTRSSSSVCIGVSFRSASAIGAPLLSRDARRPAPRAPGVESRAASAVRSRPGIALDSDGRSIAEKRRVAPPTPTGASWCRPGDAIDTPRSLSRSRQSRSEKKGGPVRERGKGIRADRSPFYPSPRARCLRFADPAPGFH